MVLFYSDVLPFIAMVIVECTNVGLNVIYKEAYLKGMNYPVFVYYSSVVATVILVPCFLLFNRDVKLPPNRLGLVLRISHLGVTGYFALLCSYAGIAYSSATLSSALSNMVPALTFVLAITFRMENPAWKSQSTQAKMVGTAISIAGACVVTFYRGPTIIKSTPPPTPNLPLYQQAKLSLSNWAVGGLLLATQYFLLSVWNIFQTQAVKIYPAVIRLVFFYYLSVTVMSSIVGLVAERNLSAWELGVDVRLAAVLYAGLLYSTSTMVHTWALRLKGPVYVAMFRPMSIAIAAIMSAIFLGESLHLGCIIGSVIICVGFYTVLWGMAKEEKAKELKESLSTEAEPLLQNVAVERDVVVRP